MLTNAEIDRRDASRKLRKREKQDETAFAEVIKKSPYTSGRHKLDLPTLDPQSLDLGIKPLQPTTGIANIVELGLSDFGLHVLAGLDETPQGPHGVRGRAPCAHLLLQLRDLTLPAFV